MVTEEYQELDEDQKEMIKHLWKESGFGSFISSEKDSEKNFEKESLGSNSIHQSFKSLSQKTSLRNKNLTLHLSEKASSNVLLDENRIGPGSGYKNTIPSVRVSF